MIYEQEENIEIIEEIIEIIIEKMIVKNNLKKKEIKMKNM